MKYLKHLEQLLTYTGQFIVRKTGSFLNKQKPYF